MKELIIKKYIENITKKDIYDFGLKNCIKLNDNEIDIIYYYVKNEWRTIIFGDINPIFNELKTKLNPKKFEDIKKLYFEFKEKYKTYL